MVRLFLGALLVVGVVAIAMWQWESGGTQQADGPGAQGFAVPVQLVTVTAKPLNVTIESVGTLLADESATLRPEIAGRIVKIQFIEGQPVKKGEVLFQLDSRLAKAQVRQAEANFKLAKLNFNRFNKLVKTGTATRQRYDEARANLDIARANLELERTRLDYTIIKAPFDGVVGLRNVSPGEFVEVGQELANFVSYDPMKVRFSIPETKAGELVVGQEIDILVEALPGKHFGGIVYALDPQLDVEARAVSLRARVPNSERLLRPGYFARIELITERKAHALTIPESAIVPNGNDKFVYVLQADETVNLVPVSLGARLTGEVEILSGLEIGNQVVTSGQIKLRPGAKVMDIAKLQGANGGAPAGGKPENTEPTSNAVTPEAPSQGAETGSEPSGE